MIQTSRVLKNVLNRLERRSNAQVMLSATLLLIRHRINVRAAADQVRDQYLVYKANSVRACIKSAKTNRVT